jgi:hypothetical protein
MPHRKGRVAPRRVLLRIIVETDTPLPNLAAAHTLSLEGPHQGYPHSMRILHIEGELNRAEPRRKAISDGT